MIEITKVLVCDRCGATSKVLTYYKIKVGNVLIDENSDSFLYIALGPYGEDGDGNHLELCMVCKEKLVETVANFFKEVD